MSARSIRKKEVNPSNNEKVEVLYQRIGNRWYAFSEKNNDVFFGTVPDDALDAFEGIENSEFDLGSTPEKFE